MDKLRVFSAVLLLSVAWINSSTAHVNLLDPKGGETFIAGDNFTIKWEVVIEHVPIDFDLHFSPDGGVTWEELAVLQVDRFDYLWTVPDIETEQAQIRITQDNEATDYTAISSNFRIRVVTAVEEPRAYPTEFEFLSYYPNPFQSETTIKFALPHHNHVSVEIYSIHGIKVAALMDEVLSAGQYSITWDASRTKPGLYLFRVQAGTFVETRKLVKLE